MDKSVEDASEKLRSFMFEMVYHNKAAKSEEDKAERMLTEMYNYFIDNLDKMPETFIALLEKYPREQVVCDYISSMTDRYAIFKFNSIFMPNSWDFLD